MLTLGAGTSDPTNLRIVRKAVWEAVTAPPSERQSGDSGMRHIRSTVHGEMAAKAATSETAAGRPRRTTTVRRYQALSISNRSAAAAAAAAAGAIRGGKACGSARLGLGRHGMGIC